MNGYFEPIEDFVSGTKEFLWFDYGLTNAYLKFLPGRMVSLHTATGQQVSLIPNMRWGTVHDTFKLEDRTLLEAYWGIVRGEYGTPARIGIMARETGRNSKDDKHAVYLSMVIGEPGASVKVSRTRQLVPACKACDALLFSRFLPTMASNEFKLEQCPYCGQPLEPYLRTSFVHELEPATSNEDKFSMQEQSPNGEMQQVKRLFPVMYRGMIRPLKMELRDAENFVKCFTTMLPKGLFGPCKVDFNLGMKPVMTITGLFSANEAPREMPAFVPLDPGKISPKSALYDKDVPMAEKIAAASAQIDKAADNTVKNEAREKKRKVSATEIKNSVFDLSALLASGRPHDARRWLSNAYLSMSGTKRNIEFAKYYTRLLDENGKEVTVPVKLPSKPQPLPLSEITIRQAGLRILVYAIQHNDAKQFSEVKFFVLESMKQYERGDPHYYLEPVLNEPDHPTRLPKSTYKVKACKHCDVALLRYSFDWVMQRDDLEGPDCPYCHEPLEVIERERRVVPVTLDFNATDCKITGTNNQIGAIYHDQALKLTIKVKSMLHFLQNYQFQFPNKAMGPFRIKLSSQFGALTITDIAFEPLKGEVNWRPIVLYPEDLIAY